MDDSKDSAYVKAAKAREAASSDGPWQLGCIAGIALVGLLGYIIFGGDSSDGRASEAMKFVVAQEAVKQRLRDPDSAEFRNERIGSYQGNEVVCGEVNSANGFGGMGGFQRYVSNGSDATVLEEQMEPGDFITVWTSMGC